MLPSALSIVMNMFQEGAERNKALGIWGAIAASGATVGLVTGGLLTRYAGWQYIFYLNVPIGGGRARARPADRPREPARHDAPAVRRARRDHRHRRAGAAGGRDLPGTAVRMGRHENDRGARGVRGAAGRVPGDREPGRGADPAAVDLPAADARRARTPRGCCWVAASSRSSSSARCTCSRCCTTARCSPASRGWPRH